MGSRPEGSQTLTVTIPGGASQLADGQVAQAYCISACHRSAEGSAGPDLAARWSQSRSRLLTGGRRSPAGGYSPPSRRRSRPGTREIFAPAGRPISSGLGCPREGQRAVSSLSTWFIR